MGDQIESNIGSVYTALTKGINRGKAIVGLLLYNCSHSFGVSLPKQWEANCCFILGGGNPFGLTKLTVALEFQHASHHSVVSQLIVLLIFLDLKKKGL